MIFTFNKQLRQLRPTLKSQLEGDLNTVKTLYATFLSGISGAITSDLISNANYLANFPVARLVACATATTAP